MQDDQMQNKHRALLALIAAAPAGLLSGAARAAAPIAYPTKPIRLIVPFVAGGGTDILARMLANAMGTRLGQSFVVDNVAGAGGTIGAVQAARAQADGYTLMAGTPGTIHINPAMQSNLRYSAENDFVPVSQFSDSPMVMVVNKDSPFNSVNDLLAACRAKPGALNFGSAGQGSITHLSSELLCWMAKVKMTHVPYKGTAQSLVDLRSGNIQVIIENLPAVLPLIQGKELKALGMGASKRSSFLPDLPTIAESGVPNYESSSWSGLFAPAATPAAVVEKLQEAAMDAARDANVIKSARLLGAETVGSNSVDFHAYLARRRVSITELIKATGLTAAL